jgi:hypothetical protein
MSGEPLFGSVNGLDQIEGRDLATVRNLGREMARRQFNRHQNLRLSAKGFVPSSYTTDNAQV